MCGNTFSAATPAMAHNLFIEFQILERFIGRPLRETKTFPLDIEFSLQYLLSFAHKALGRSILRFFPLQLTCASCRFRACTVIYCNSLTRIPVEQIVCRIKARRLSPLLCAVSTSLKYSSRVSSLFLSQKICLCCFIRRTRHSYTPIYANILFTATNIELMLDTAYFSSTRWFL